MEFKSYREGSRIDYGRDLCPTQQFTKNEIELGAILRIADATELMARRYIDLIGERDCYKQSAKQERQYNELLCRRIAGLRGHITRLKKQKKKR